MVTRLNMVELNAIRDVMIIVTVIVIAVVVRILLKDSAQIEQIVLVMVAHNATVCEGGGCAELTIIETHCIGVGTYITNRTANTTTVTIAYGIRIYACCALVTAFLYLHRCYTQCTIAVCMYLLNIGNH